MSKQQLEMARTLIESKQYDEARKLLLTIDHPTAKKWLAKLDEIAPQRNASVPKPAGANYIPLALVAVVVLVTFLLALYAAFIRPVGVSAAELPKVPDVQGIVSTEIQPVSTRLDNIEKSLQTTSQTSVQWEYLAMSYYQFPDLDNSTKKYEGAYTDHSEYDKDFSDGCKQDDTKCRQSNFRGERYYLEILGKDGWELIIVEDKSDQYTYHAELTFKRQRKTVGQ